MRTGNQSRTLDPDILAANNHFTAKRHTRREGVELVSYLSGKFASWSQTEAEDPVWIVAEKL
jgi:hypothetical protein